MRVTTNLQEIATSLSQATDSCMELASQLHAIMNHVKQACSLVTNFRNESMPSIHQIQAVANTQWGQADALTAIQELSTAIEDREKKHSDLLKALQQQLDKVQARLTPPMPTKAPPPSPPTPATTTPTASTTTPAGSAPSAPSSSATPQTPSGQPQTFGPASSGDAGGSQSHNTGQPPVIRIQDNMPARQPLQLFGNMSTPANRWAMPPLHGPQGPGSHGWHVGRNAIPAAAVAVVTRVPCLN